MQLCVAASYQSYKVHRHTGQDNRQAEHQESDKTQALLPVVAALIKEFGYTLFQCYLHWFLYFITTKVAPFLDILPLFTPLFSFFYVYSRL